jgi:cytoskeletal protein CcmA (bactofilin family)
VRAAFAAGTWFDGPGASVPAGLLRELLLGRQPPQCAVRIRGARIEGALQLNLIETRVPIMLEDCELTDPPNLYWSRLGYFSLQGSRVPGLLASNARFDGHLRLTRAVVDGEVRLRGGVISGGLLLDGARLTNAGGRAVYGERLQMSGDLLGTDVAVVGGLYLDLAQIEGRLTLDGASISAPGALAVSAGTARIAGGVYARRAAVEGEISLRDAQIGSGVVLSGARLTNPGGVALRLSRASSGGVFLGSGFHASGEVRMHLAQISHGLTLSDATLDVPGGVALDLDGTRVDGDVNGHRLTVDGAVLVRSAVISNFLQLSGATITGAILDGRPVALNATGVQVGRVADCGNGFRADAAVRFSGARVGGLTFAGGRLAGDGPALVAFRMQARELDLSFAEPPGGTVNVSYSAVDILQDEPRTWPARLRLDGLVYGALRPALPPEQRLAWLHRTGPGYLPQPFEQLARTYRGVGDDRAARAVHLAQQRRRRATLAWPARAWGWLQDIMVGYGYQPARAALWLVALLLLGTAYFQASHPAVAGIGRPPAFNAFLYTLDLLLPIIDLTQQSAYAPIGTGSQLVADGLIVAGWTLATTIAAGATRALRRD